MSGHSPPPQLQPGENPGSSTFQGRMAAWRAVSPSGDQGGVLGGTGFFSVMDGHELGESELASSNLVIGGDGFVYQPTFSERVGTLPDGTVGTVNEISGFQLAPKWLQEEVLGLGDDGGSGGPRGPTAAELAIDRAAIQAQNLSTFIDSTINQISGEIEAGRLKTEQALGEFNRRLDAFSEAGEQFTGLQPFTITPGSKFLPGRQPGGVGERLGRPVLEASPIFIDPFQMAADIVAGTPNIADIGVPETDLLAEAVAVARGFI